MGQKVQILTRFSTSVVFLAVFCNCTNSCEIQNKTCQVSIIASCFFLQNLVQFDQGRWKCGTGKCRTGKYETNDVKFEGPKMRYWKMRDWKCTTGKCRTWKMRLLEYILNSTSIRVRRHSFVKVWCCRCLISCERRSVILETAYSDSLN